MRETIRRLKPAAARFSGGVFNFARSGLLDNRSAAFAHDRWSQSENAVENGAECVDVGPFIRFGAIPIGLLRSHEAECPEKRVWIGVGLNGGKAKQPLAIEGSQFREMGVAFDEFVQRWNGG